MPRRKKPPVVEDLANKVNDVTEEQEVVAVETKPDPESNWKTIPDMCDGPVIVEAVALLSHQQRGSFIRFIDTESKNVIKIMYLDRVIPKLIDGKEWKLST